MTSHLNFLIGASAKFTRTAPLFQAITNIILRGDVDDVISESDSSLALSSLLALQKENENEVPEFAVNSISVKSLSFAYVGSG